MFCLNINSHIILPYSLNYCDKPCKAPEEEWLLFCCVWIMLKRFIFLQNVRRNKNSVCKLFCWSSGCDLFKLTQTSFLTSVYFFPHCGIRVVVSRDIVKTVDKEHTKVIQKHFLTRLYINFYCEILEIFY